MSNLSVLSRATQVRVIVGLGDVTTSYHFFFFLNLQEVALKYGRYPRHDGNQNTVYIVMKSSSTHYVHYNSFVFSFLGVDDLRCQGKVLFHQ